MKSTLGYIYLLAWHALSSKTIKQSHVTCSTMVAKFIAPYKMFNHGIWLWNFVTRLCIVDDIDKKTQVILW